VSKRIQSTPGLSAQLLVVLEGFNADVGLVSVVVVDGEVVVEAAVVGLQILQ